MPETALTMGIPVYHFCRWESHGNDNEHGVEREREWNRYTGMGWNGNQVVDRVPAALQRERGVTGV